MSTLNENILLVQDTFADIASAIEEQGVAVGECDSPTTYADKIRSIDGSGSGLGINPYYLSAEVYELPDTASEPTVDTTVTEDGGVVFTFGLRRGAAGQDGEDGKDGVDGKDGEDGIDGSTYEYVYFRGLTEEDKPSDIASGEGNNQDDYVPTYTKTVNVNGNSVILKWTDRAQGVDETYKFEWRSERKKNDANTWSDFTAPILWAKYGEKGKDGDGVQYIFTTTSKNEAPANPIVNLVNFETDEAYQNTEGEEYIPSIEVSGGQVWEDNPIELDGDTKKYCWVSVRKYRNGQWKKYSDPTLWTKWVDSSGTVTGDVLVIDMDPDWAMINSDESSVETTIRAFRGDDPVIIQDVTNISESVSYTFNASTDDSGITWKVVISNINSTLSTIPVKLEIQLSEELTRTKTFNIYQTKTDADTISLDLWDDNILVPCSDGNTPDSGFFDSLELPMSMRVAGELVTITSISTDVHSNYFSLTETGNLKITGFPGSKQREVVKITASDGTNSASAYLNFTKFNTHGGTVSMYTLNVSANDIVCDTRNNKNEYKVYTGKQGVSDNSIIVKINKYSGQNEIISLSELPSDYAVFYANDPEDWSEDASSTIGEYVKMDDNGIVIGETIAPDKCVSFQLRQWIGEGDAWSDMSDGNYIIWDFENILVDIIREVSSYQFVVTPDKIHINTAGEVVLPSDGLITIGLSKNVAGDGESILTALDNVPTGYDIYYEIDNNGNEIKLGGESEIVSLPATIDVSKVTNSVVLYLVVNENSEDDKKIVLSETIEVTSDVPGETAYVGYLTDSLGVVSCDANGNPEPGQTFSTTFKVTNGTNVKINDVTGTGFTAIVDSNNTDTIVFSDFQQSLNANTKVTLTATYTAKDDTEGIETAEYTIIKLQNAESSTILDFSNSNIIVPCDETNSPLIESITTHVTMMHGDESLILTTEDQNVTLGTVDSEGYYPITLAISNVIWNDSTGKYTIPFTGTSTTSGETYKRTGELLFTKLKAGESGKIWDLVLSNDSPKFNNDTDKFDDDYIEGWINVWDSDTWNVASFSDLTAAERYIVYKAAIDSDSKYAPLGEADFDSSNHFKIYINPLSEGTTGKYVDLDTPSGVDIALAELVNGAYKVIQSERMQASYDGRDFSKFELMLSDSAIYQIWDNENQLISSNPNEIKILGIFEHDGLDRTKYEGTIHNHHVSGLDIYYSIDGGAEQELSDTNGDGWVTNDTIPLTDTDGNLITVANVIDVYLYAHYNTPGDGTDDTVRTLVDHKELRVYPINIPVNYIMALSQDEIKVPIDELGIVDSGFTVNVTPYLYCNDDLQNVDFQYVFGNNTQPTTGWEENKTFEASDFSGNYTHIWFKPSNKDIYKACKITKEYNPIEIFIDKQVVKREISDNLVHDSITLELKKWNYTSNLWEAITEGYTVYMNYTSLYNSNVEIVQISPTSSNQYVIDLNNNSYEGIDYIKFVIYDANQNEKGFEEVNVITDGSDGSSREVIYYKSELEVPNNPTPSNYAENTSYQVDDSIPSNWTYPSEDGMTDEVAALWVDEFPGVDTTYKFIYACERKRPRGVNSKWGAFSDPKLYAKHVENGENAWSWRLSDPIEMVSYNSNGDPNGTINGSTTVLANYGGKVANVKITGVTSGFGTYADDTFTLNTLPTDGSDFTITIKATGTYEDNGTTYTDTAELKYTVKKWFGEPATVQVHLSNDSSPVTTDSNGIYPNSVVRTAELTASSGKTNIGITDITTSDKTITLDWDAPTLTITIPTSVTGWSSDDVLTVPLVCTLADGYDSQTVIMSFYKVRAAKEAEYPDVYDLLVYPTSILVGVNQETGEANYETTTITPTVIKYTATNETKVLTASEFNALEVGSIKYSFDGNNNIQTLSEDTFTVSGEDDADEYVDVVMEITNGKTQTERVLISHDPIPNIDWELELNCSERILYKSDKETQITNVENVSCRLYKTVGGTKNYVDISQDYFGFDIWLYLDGVKQTNPYTIDDVIELDDFVNSCEFVLVNPGGEGEEDVVWDRKLVTKEYAEPGTPGTPGTPGESTVVTQLSNPASIIQIVKGEFASTTAQTNLQVRKGSEFVQVSSVVIGAVRSSITAVENPGDYLTLAPTLDENSPYDTNTLEFTLGSKVSKIAQTIEADLNITVGDVVYTETKTIIIQYASENSVHLELTEDFVNVTDYDVKLISEDNPITTKAVLYDGLAEAVNEAYSAEFINCDGSCDGATGEVKVTEWDDSIKSASVIITAVYENGSYSRTFVLNRSPYNWKLHLSHDIIKDNEREAITGVVRVSGSRLDAIENSKFFIEYSIDDSNEWTDLSYTAEQAGFTIPVEDAIENVTKHLIVRIRDINDHIYDQETIGLVKNGENASYYQIGVNYSWIVKDHNGEVMSPLDTIKPIVWLINGSTKKSVTFTELTTAGYKIHVKIDDTLYENSFTANDFTNGISLDTVTINTQLVFYLYENTVTDPTTDNWYDYVEVDVVTNGNPGTSGPVIYPAGEYNSTKTYTGTSKKAPYVFDSASEKYYIAYGTCTNLVPIADDNLISDPDWSNITKNGWVQMESYNAIYSDIGVFGQALVGKWIFYGDYMFSQMGTLNGTSSNEYEEFYANNWLSSTDTNYVGDTTDKFIPNVVMNARTGDAWFGNKKIYLGSDGSGYLGSAYRWDANGNDLLKVFRSVHFTGSTGDDVSDEYDPSDVKVGDEVYTLFTCDNPDVNSCTYFISKPSVDGKQGFIYTHSLINISDNVMTITYVGHSNYGDNNQEFYLQPNSSAKLECYSVGDEVFYVPLSTGANASSEV